MASLEDFSGQESPTLDDFGIGKNQVAPVVSKASNLNLATYAAAMSGDPEAALNNYRQINAELDFSGQSELSDQLVKEAQQKSQALNTKALVELLADPSVSDEVKQQAANNTLDETNSQYSLRNLLSVEALSADVKNEEPRAEFHRVDTAGLIQSVNAYKREEQAILNAELSKESPGAIKATADFIGILLPFAESKVAGTLLSRVRDGDATAYVESFTLLGESKVELRDMLSKVPPEERLALTQSVVDIINESSGIVLPDGNDFARKDYLQTVLDQGSYDNADRWLDNIFSVLDITVIGGIIGRVAKSGLKGTALAVQVERASEIVSNVTKRAVKSRVQPTTISQNYKDTNVDKARAAHVAVVDDTTGEAAEALYGSSRQDAIVHDSLPEILNRDGTVMAKVSGMDKAVALTDNVDLEVLDFARNDGALYAFTAEKAQARAASVNRLENVVGMSARKEMFQYSTTGEGFGVRAVYGPTEGGFANATDALNMAKWALRDEGVQEGQLKLLVRDGPNYRQATPEEFDAVSNPGKIVTTKGGKGGKKPTTFRVTQPKDVLVAVDHNYSFRPGDVMKWSETDVKYNIWDRINVAAGAKTGSSAQRNFLDPASLFGEQLSGAASVAVDRAAGIENKLVEMVRPMAEKFNKADPEIRGVMQKLIKEANAEGKDFNYAEMVAAGLRDNEISALHDWRRYWDTVYHLENRDLSRTLSNRGYKEFVSEASDTRLFAKPLKEGAATKVDKVFDPETGKIIRMSQSELKELYAKGGTVASMRQPMKVGDDVAEHVFSVNTPGSNYFRAITDDTQVLNYRKGYYSVQYKDPYFVVEKVKDARGNLLYEKAIATAGSKQDAEALAASKASNEGKVAGDDFYARGDIKKAGISGDDFWDLQQARGRSAQRVRGKRLEEADTNVQNPDQSNILDPVESMILAARSVSTRTSMRDILETTKTRFTEQYKEFLPNGEFGQKLLPGDMSGIQYRGGGPENARKLADARSTFEYIKYLEDGYINSIDDTYKAILKSISDIAGNAGLAKTDSALKWMAEGRGPSAMGKNIAFTAYLATNPIRQFVVQGHQAVQLISQFPGYMASGRMVPQTTVLTMMQAGIKKVPEAMLKGTGWTAEEAADIFEQFKRSGQVAAIDKQNLIRGSLMDLADQMKLGQSQSGKAWRVVTSPISVSRKIGFDAGEYVNTVSSWLAHYDSAAKRGLDMSNTEEQARVSALARNFTYNMNAAGDMKYNQTSLQLLFQFMQVPHKAMLTMLTNRQLTKMQKARLITFNGLMYSLPPAAMYSWFGEGGLGVLPEDGEARDAVVQGLEGYVFNKMLSMATGEKSDIDFSGLAPLDMYGSMEFVHNLMTTDIGTLVASSPSGQLFAGNNPRITNFMKSAARYTNLIDDYEDPTTFGMVAKEFAKISSGYSNAMKASYAMEYDRKYGTLGGTTNSNIPTPTAMALAFGFQSLDDARNRYVSDRLYNESKSFEDDVKASYKSLKQHMGTKYNTLEAEDFAMRAYSEAFRVFGNDNARAKRIIDGLLRKDIADKAATPHKRILDSAGFMDADQLKELSRNLKFDDDKQRQDYQDLIDFIQQQGKE
jgi:hypothetical protein